MSQSERTAKLSMFEKIGYGLGDAGFNFYWAIIGSYLLYFYTDIFGLAPAAAAWMFGLTRLIDALTDPAMGFIADRTETRWGKFRPYLLFGALPMAGAAILTMSTPDLGDTGKLIWAFGTYSAMMLAYTVLSTPYSSLAGVLTADSNERNSIFGIRFFFAYFTGIIVGAATPDLAAWFGGDDEAKGWQLTMALYASVATILFWVSFATTRERVQPPKAQKSNVGQDLLDLINNRPWLILFALAMIIMITIVMRGSSSAYYFKYFVERPDLMGLYIGLQMAAYAIGALSAPLLVRYIEKAKLLMVLMSVVGVLCIAYTFVPKPEANGVVTITVDETVTLRADELLGDTHKNGDQYRWTVDDKIFWIFKDRVTLDAGLNATGDQIQLTGAKNKVISVIKTREGQNGTVVTDSSDLPVEIIIMFILNIMISLALGPKSPVTWSMYADAADFNEWKTGRRATAMTFSAATFSQKIGGTVASIAIGSVLASIGYSANQIQTGASQAGIVMLQTLVPGLFAFVALIALKFYDLSDEKLRQIQLDLQAREQ